MRRFLEVLIFTTAALTAPVPVRGELLTLETRDLHLIWSAPIQSFVVPYTARCFLNSMRFHRELFQYTPSEPVTVILDDTSDYSNAGVWVTPRNSMLVQLAPVNFVFETGPSNERMNFTMNHEVVHVVALDQAAGSDRLFRSIFRAKIKADSEHPETMLYSYLTMPRRSTPRWYHEGIAVFLETWMAGGIGRAQGPYDEMVFRSMVRDGSRFYDPLGLEVEGTATDFQVGVNSYLYGTRFLSYIAYEYTPEKLIEWVGRKPGSKAYYGLQFRKVYGASLNEVWKDWIRWERGFQEANLDSIRQYATTPYKDLTKRGLGSVSRAFVDTTTATLYAAVQYPGTVAHIAAIPLGGGEIRNIQEVKGPALYFVSSMALDVAGRRLFYTTDNNAWRDVRVLDLDTGKSKVLLRDARIGDLTYRSTDRSLWGVRHFNGVSTLVRIPEPYTTWNQVASWPFGRDIYDIDISPDGELLSGSLAEVNGSQALRLWRVNSLLQSDTTSVLLHDFGTAIPTSFVFSPEGRYLYGSSYYTGVSNIFRYDLDADSMEIVTNCETGMFRPVAVRGDSVIVFRYTGEGFVPSWIEAHPLQDVSAVTYLGERIAAKHPIVRSWVAPSPASVSLSATGFTEAPYRGFPAVGLSGLYPVVEGYKDYTAMGVHADLSDPLGFHRFGLTLSNTPSPGIPPDERWHAHGTYERLDWTVRARYNEASFYDLAGPTKQSRKGYGASIGYRRTLIDDAPTSLKMTATVSGFGGIERLPEAQNVETSSGFDKLLSGRIGLSYQNMRASIGATDYEKGYKWEIQAADNGVRFVRVGRGVWRGYPRIEGTFDAGTPMPVRNSSLWLRTAGGYSPGDEAEPFANFFFGGFGNNWVDHQSIKRYRESSSFPGVELDEIAGTNYAKVLVDCNLPSIRFRRVGTPAFHAMWIRPSLFASGLVTHLEGGENQTRIGNLGGQVDLRLRALSHESLTLSFGYARAFERRILPREEWMVSLKIL